MSINVTTPFPLGVFVGNPNASDPTAEAVFDASYQKFATLMGTQAQFMNAFGDATQPISAWASNAGWAAWSFSSSPVGKTMIPVIGLPMASSAAGALTADQTYQNFAAGTYDSMLQAMVKNWADNGFKTQYWRPGVEMNLNGNVSSEGTTPAQQADWVAAFQHISNVLHAAGQANGVNVQVVWNPGVTNASISGSPIQTVYPGNQYVDVIGADAYGEIYPYGGPTPYDWATGKTDTSVQAWASNPVNLQHYYTYPAATQWALDSSGGSAVSLQNLIDFAKAQGKPISICETGAGNSADGAGVTDNPAFVQWLSSTLINAGVKVAFVNIWDSNGGGTYSFSNPTDGKPLEAAAWAKYFGAQTTSIAVTPTTSGVATTDAASVKAFSGIVIADTNPQQTETAKVTLSNPLNGVLSDPNAAADGSTITSGVWSVTGTAAAVASAMDALVFTPTAHQVAPGQTVTTVLSAAITDTAGQTAATTSTVTTTALALQGAITIGSGPDILALQMSEDAYLGNAQFTIKVDGTQIGGIQTASVLHSTGQSQTYNVLGSFAPGAHTVSVTFLNDAYGGSATTDRNLYVNSATINGTPLSPGSLALKAQGWQSLAFIKASAPVDTLVVAVSEEAWQGDAQYTINIDGTPIGGVRTATSSHAAGAWQNVSLTGTWGNGPHTVGISFINDASGGTPQTDRNLYVNSVTYDGLAATGAPATLFANSTANFLVPAAIVQTAVTLHLAEDAWQGNAQYSVAIDGVQIGQAGTVSALNASGSSQSVVLNDMLSVGTHDLAVSFLNDSYGGSAAMDRNLYVKGIEVNGVAVANGTASLNSNGTSHFQIVVPHT